LIADPDVGVIDLALQPWLRVPVVECAAAAGAHLRPEPMAMSLRQGVHMWRPASAPACR